MISVAMCTYNGEAYLREQLQSIVDQSWKNLDIVIVDDCSTDGTVALLREFAAVDNRIRVFENPENLGFIRNFSRAIQECQADYIALADQDDVWLPDKLATLMAEIGDNLLIYSRVSLIDGDGNPLDGTFPRVKRIEGHCPLSLIFDNCVTGHACLLRKELVDRALPFPVSLLAHDQWLAIAAAASAELKASDQVLSLYRLHQRNTVFGWGKDKVRQAKVEKNRVKLERTLGLCESLLLSGLLSEADSALLRKMHSLLQQNERCLYNRPLHSFLDQHQADFLGLYRQPRKALPKICRGLRYYRLADGVAGFLQQKS